MASDAVDGRWLNSSFHPVMTWFKQMASITSLEFEVAYRKEKRSRFFYLAHEYVVIFVFEEF